MRKLFISECTLTSAGKAYESILRGTLPDLTVIAKEHALYFTSIPPFEPTGNFYTVQTPITQKIYSEDSKPRTLLAWNSYIAHRHLPVNTQLTIMPTGVLLTTPNNLLDTYTPLHFPNPLQEVMTAKEIAMHYQISIKSVIHDIQTSFSSHEKKVSGQDWLVTKEAVLFYYENKEIESPYINPLLRVFTTLEASHLWKKAANEVRSAASGSGHRTARMDSNDCRKAERTWLVTYEAMEKLFGTPSYKEWSSMIQNLNAE